MKIAVVTTMNTKLFEAYGHRFLNTYNWPFDCFVYHEDDFYDVMEDYSYGADGITPTSANTTVYLAKTVSVPADTSLIVVDTPIYLMEGDIL